MLTSSQTSQEKLGYNVELKGPGAVARDWKCAKRNKNDRKQSVLGLGREVLLANAHNVL